ncbi:hypothetical protein WUBG_16550 [Wuchereria bancrofti]|uniref:Uncharacterized protein n=1 Tax=Wuchereria bancrofti TaxID=6293 RepID=J9DSF0_WUCBA|nr:hypothetical protein WUBG_16550 [Wuchereria bancrofti]
MPYEEFQRLIDMNANSITNYKKNGKVPTTIAVIAVIISDMKDDGLDFYPIFEKVRAYRDQ